MGDAATLEIGARRLVTHVCRAIERGEIDARSPIGDACLDLRDTIDPNWEPRAEGDALADAIEATRAAIERARAEHGDRIRESAERNKPLLDRLAREGDCLACSATEGGCEHHRLPDQEEQT